MTETDVVRIFRVDTLTTRVPGLSEYVIHATKVAQPSHSLVLQTVNSYAASLCQRAKETGRSIAVEWERTTYGCTITRAYFLKVEAA